MQNRGQVKDRAPVSAVVQLTTERRNNVKHGSTSEHKRKLSGSEQAGAGSYVRDVPRSCIGQWTGPRRDVNEDPGEQREYHHQK